MKSLPLWATFMANAAWEMQPDTTFQDQQKEVASLIEEQPDMAKVMEKAMKNYARQCVIASLEKAAYNASTIFTNAEHTYSKVHKPSITHESNIILL